MKNLPVTIRVGLVALLLQAGLVLAPQPASAQLSQHRETQGLTREEAGAPVDPDVLPPGVRIIRDVAYGSDTRQRFDVYAPAQATHAPVIFMVHGGAWALGDKTSAHVVENKVRRWAPKGVVLVSVNYRTLPNTPVEEQARDVACALAAAQTQAASWGADPTKFILMGHSAGAHLIALIAASPTLGKDARAAPWLGSVMLDSAAYDVAKIMRARHFALYDRAFGGDPVYWNSVSPYAALVETTMPMLAVCSTRRANSCEQADEFVRKASSIGARASVLRENLKHDEINSELGEAGTYTDAVENFLRSLDVSVARLLDARIDAVPATGQ